MVLGLFYKEEHLDVVDINHRSAEFTWELTVMAELPVQAEKGSSVAGVSFLKSTATWG